MAMLKRTLLLGEQFLGELPSEERRPAYTYKDFITGKIRRTYGRFVKWHIGGIAGVYAVFALSASNMFIPACSLTPETKVAIGVEPNAFSGLNDGPVAVVKNKSRPEEG